MFGWFKKKADKPNGRRSYNGAVNTRFTSKWVLQTKDINSELRSSLQGLRGHSRELAENNEYINNYLQMCKSEIIGARGIKLQSRVKNSNDTPDLEAIKKIETEWKKWSKRGNCTMCGRMSFRDVQKLVIESVARDGEFLIRMIKGKAAGNRWNFGLQLLEADYLDEQYNTKLKNGNRIKMGVEVNSFEKPIAYHFLTDHPGQSYRDGRAKRIRVPADEIIHVMVIIRQGQARGVPWTSAAMQTIKNLEGYMEAEIVAARAAAAKGGFYKSDELSDNSDQDGNEKYESTIIEEVEAGQVSIMPSGFEFQAYDPQHSTSQVPSFLKSILRGIAAALGVSYTPLANDYEGVNFSSIRSGDLKDQDKWRDKQYFLVENCLDIIFENWLAMAIVSDAVRLPFHKLDKWLAWEFQPRGWMWVDPVKEANANKIAIEMKFKSHSEVAADQGKDFEELCARIASDEKIAEKYGVDLTALAADGGVQVIKESEEDDEDEEKPSKHKS